MGTLPSFVLAGLPTADAVTPASRMNTTLSSCRETDLAAAVAAGGTVTFGTDCSDLLFSTPITVPTGNSATIDSNGHTVVLDGAARSRLFVLTGGSLTLSGLTLTNGASTGTPGSDGSPGQPGHSGGNAGGAAIAVLSGTLLLNDDTITDNQSTGGSGGRGGAGPAGRNGGDGGAGGNALGGAIFNAGDLKITGSTFSANEADGGKGGAGGSGGIGRPGHPSCGNGGRGGNAGAGGGAFGGAIYNIGTLTIEASSFDSNRAVGGGGGRGGDGGPGTPPPQPGVASARAVDQPAAPVRPKPPCDHRACPASGGNEFGGRIIGLEGVNGSCGPNAGNGGAGGNGGDGGSAFGGAIDTPGSHVITNTTFSNNQAIGGPGGPGGNGGPDATVNMIRAAQARSAIRATADPWHAASDPGPTRGRTGRHGTAGRPGRGESPAIHQVRPQAAPRSR